MNDFIRANGGMLAVMAVIVAIGAAYLEWRIGEHVTEQFEAAGLISPDRMSAAEQDIQEVRGQHHRDADKLDAKIEKIVDILLSE